MTQSYKVQYNISSKCSYPFVSKLSTSFIYFHKRILYSIWILYYFSVWNLIIYIVIKHSHVLSIVDIKMVLLHSGQNDNDVKVLLSSFESLLIKLQIKKALILMLNLGYDERLCSLLCVAWNFIICYNVLVMMLSLFTCL